MARKTKGNRVSGRPQLSLLSPKGQEIPDSQPAAPSVKATRARSIRENMLEIIRSERFRTAMEEAGEETFEEADDFDVDDDYDPSSPYEEFFEGEYAQLREARMEQAAEERRKKRRGRKPAPTESEQSGKRSGKVATDGADPSSKAGSARNSNSPGETPRT